MGISYVLVVNFFGGPGSRKSTTRAKLFANLKVRGINCEEAPEYAKDIVWEERFNILNQQIYILAKQDHRLRRLDGKVDVAITDSPLVLSSIYGKNESPEFHAVVRQLFDSYRNFNVYLQRGETPYNPAGRTQSLIEAKALDLEIADFLRANDIPIHAWVLSQDKKAVKKVSKQVRLWLQQNTQSQDSVLSVLDSPQSVRDY